MDGRVKHKVGDRKQNTSGYWFTLKERLPGGKMVVQFDPPYDSEEIVSASSYGNGSIRNHLAPNKFGGVCGKGGYDSYRNTKLYDIWSKLLERVEHPWLNQRNVSYAGCSICGDWRNFQVFAEWYYNQKGSDMGWHLEKDLLVRGNKYYSPETCVLVPQDVNMFLTKRKSCRTTLIGVTYRARTGRYLSQFTRGTKSVFLGSFATELEAHLAYKVAKEEYAKVLAEKYKDVLDERAYLALLNYSVEITD